MPETSIKDQIKRLVDLQRIDAEIYNLKKQLDEKPVFIEELKQRFEENKATLKKLEDKLKHILLARKEQELELKSQEESITKANTQLSQIKTNKEYTAKLSEIESIKADKSIIEEKILLFYEEGDGVSAEVAKEKTKVADEEKNFLAEKKKIEDDIKEIEEKVEVFEVQRKQILPEIEKNCLARYEKILSHKEGLAIVPVRNNICGGCYMNIPHQTTNAIKMHDSFVECEMCSRILYLEEDL